MLTRILRPTTTAAFTRVSLTARSFSVARPTLNADNKDDEEEGKKGFLKSVLYGKDVNGVAIPGDNTTHSKQLARGKYVHEMQSKSFFFFVKSFLFLIIQV
jgi:hypothetical protein